MCVKMNLHPPRRLRLEIHTPAKNGKAEGVFRFFAVAAAAARLSELNSKTENLYVPASFCLGALEPNACYAALG